MLAITFRRVLNRLRNWEKMEAKVSQILNLEASDFRDFLIIIAGIS